jgi:antitoxin VapB
MESTARLFVNGRSQAVRLPKAFRFEGSQVRIRKEGERVILEPMTCNEWPEGFWDGFTPDLAFEIPPTLAVQPVDLDRGA